MLQFDEILRRLDKNGPSAPQNDILANPSTAADSNKHLVWGERGVHVAQKDKIDDLPSIVESEEIRAVNQVEDIDQEELDQDIARVKLEVERSFINHMLLSRPAAVPIAPARGYVKDEVHNGTESFVNPNLVNSRELVFADKVHKFIKTGNKKSIVSLLKDAVTESSTDGILESVWSDVFALLDKPVEGRDDVATTEELLAKACDYLHKLFGDSMEAVVERNLEIAARGGVPGTRSLVNAYLKLNSDNATSEDDTIDGLPIWEVTYTCVRTGDVVAAKDALSHLKSFPQCATLVAALNHLASHPKLDADLKKKLKIEWRHNAGHITDKHKKALYAALLGGLESTLSNTLENWLWFKLFPLRVDPHLTPILYREVQKVIAIDYGESYFLSNGPTEYQYFFTALWLSGQFERAIYLLHECGERVDSVHVAVLAHKLGYLRMSEKSTDEMLTLDEHEPTKAYFNLARLIVGYTKSFELVDVKRAIDYWYLLKGVTTPTGSEVFEMAVSRAVYLTGDVESILGKLRADGSREKGLIDEYMTDPSTVIARVALDSELSGEWASAVAIYLLASRPTPAARLLSSQISEALRWDNEQLQTDLMAVADEYKRVQHGCEPKEFVTLSALVDFCAIFAHCRKGDAHQAFNLTKRLNIIPATSEEVAVVVGEFHMVPQKVREILPDACLALTRCIVDYCILQSGLKSNQNIFSQKSPLVKQVKAIVLYAATVPFNFPEHITSKLLQLQASLGV